MSVDGWFRPSLFESYLRKEGSSIGGKPVGVVPRRQAAQRRRRQLVLDFVC